MGGKGRGVSGSSAPALGCSDSLAELHYANLALSDSPRAQQSNGGRGRVQPRSLPGVLNPLLLRSTQEGKLSSLVPSPPATPSQQSADQRGWALPTCPASGGAGSTAPGEPNPASKAQRLPDTPQRHLCAAGGGRGAGYKGDGVGDPDLLASCWLPCPSDPGDPRSPMVTSNVAEVIVAS